MIKFIQWMCVIFFCAVILSLCTTKPIESDITTVPDLAPAPVVAPAQKTAQKPLLSAVQQKNEAENANTKQAVDKNTSSDDAPSKQDAVINTLLQSLAEQYNKDTNIKKGLKKLNINAIKFKALPADTKNHDNGTLVISVFCKNENSINIDIAKEVVTGVVATVKAQGKQALGNQFEVPFTISAQLLSDTLRDDVKHYFTRVYYLPQDPTIQVTPRDQMVQY